ncbi:ABC transporter ATP-binding protein [Paenibacillus sp. LHD-117]|uniref:ABC transporter ATP-binding protein n=1 Tax=Paenibacillus sp. LHD-117 TaxID=3071412 RepID=UPI0027E1C5F0|nr:ABC transporter ATP-binding protein [Paenibacillus sp. LHD-117]MDQ6422387.1 ABC transporter ATP-binding protein [Paenibacillus sp. LHD-117]
MGIVTLRGVHKSFGGGSVRTHVLKGVDLELPVGSLVMLKGRSGSGKTTLMNIIGGLDTPSEGEVNVAGHRLHLLGDKPRTKLRQTEIGFIFQSYALHPLLSAKENVELSLRMAGVPSAKWAERIDHCLEQVGMAQRALHRPFELSGGEQQRVAIAKAIAPSPKLLLADEPTAELDTKMSKRILMLFRQLREEGMAICMTTHDQTMLEVADDVYEMADGRLGS